MRLLPRRGPAPLRPDRPVGDAGQAAVHLPGARSAWRRSSPPATSRSPCRPGTWSRRSCAATPWSGSRPSTRAACGDALARIFHAGGVPGGVLNLVQADGEDDLRGPRAGARRGARRQGRLHRARARSAPEIGALCGRHLQSPCLELGGKNPMVVMDDADVDLAVEGALFGGFGTAGQRCTSLGTAIVHESVHDAFVAQLDERLRASAIGDPTQDVLYGPMIHERFAERFEDWLGLIEDHHTVLGSDHRGRITRRRAVGELRRRPRGRALLPPGDRRRRHDRRRDLPDGDLRPDHRRRDVLGLRRGDASSPTTTATGCRRRSTRRTR